MQLSTEEINRRIALDFNKSLNNILLEIKEIYPNPTQKQIEQWQTDKKLEFIEINGEKCYFRCAARNLFRIDNEAKRLFVEKFGDEKAERNGLLQDYLSQITKSQTPDIKQFIFSFQLRVKPDAVPDGEIIRCWLPYPRQDIEYQQNIKLISINSGKYIINQNSCHSTIYIEKEAEKNEEVFFEVKYSFEVMCCCAKRHNARRQRLLPDKLPFISEQPPHIVFSEHLKNLSSQIIGNEPNQYLKAKKIFTWISQNIVWAAAREYPTIENIPEYVLTCKHGDCGQVTLLFITLCRLNGIPARWLSGFMLHPNYENLHDWAEIFIEGKGWLPVDVSFGLQNWAENEDLKYFYFGNMDAYRLIINNGISGELLPAKIFPRSETIDFQRGEVEWKNSNLYFGDFDYGFCIG
ncbi:MAG: transglutaminase-like domain-containing protein [Prevotellaceae bacterium]|jgi:hypothetical protein|nr:transglutaminase-like domain-containing protein [Prevotellaceae bacterium]